MFTFKLDPAKRSNPVRPAAVAGMFYPGDADGLRRQVSAYLAAPQSAPLSVSPAPTFKRAPGMLKALIAPHAGYIYSGSTAGQAYARLVAMAGRIERVVLLGPCHRVALRGLAMPSVAAFATPLGNVPIDQAALASLAGLPQVTTDDAAHAEEHSLEVHLPFLQAALGAFSLAPLAVGQATASEVAEVLERLWGGDETLIVVSSDLSHYLDYAEAQRRDGATIKQILSLELLTHYEQACGAVPINGLVLQAQRRGLQIECVAQCNSGDTAGDKSRVVGYAAFALYQPETNADDDLGALLVQRARRAIARHLGQPEPPVTASLASHPALSRPGATFVTLTQNGALRGCIGSLEAHRPLAQDVDANAVAAACRDPRFPPLTAPELAQTRVEVSLLTAPQPMSFADEDDALRQLRPHIDGVIFVADHQRSTFLPQVWEQLPEPRQFMAHLKQKAGFPANGWSSEVQLFRYEVQKWKEIQA